MLYVTVLCRNDQHLQPPPSLIWNETWLWRQEARICDMVIGQDYSLAGRLTLNELELWNNKKTTGFHYWGRVEGMLFFRHECHFGRSLTLAMQAVRGRPRITWPILNYIPFICYLAKANKTGKIWQWWLWTIWLLVYKISQSCSNRWLHVQRSSQGVYFNDGVTYIWRINHV